MIDYLIGWFVKWIGDMIVDLRCSGLKRWLKNMWEWKWVKMMCVVYDIWRGLGFVLMYMIAGGASDWISTERDYWSWKGWKWWE